jgi:HTH-type transcriptional regulator, transcriptional repressor of NAD biosynthesis genes
MAPLAGFDAQQRIRSAAARMSVRYARGLVVGKFWPLHRGHQMLIDRALASCGEVVVISYVKPEYDRCSPELRDSWLATLYPAVTRLVVDDETLAQVCRSKAIEPLTLPHNNDGDDAHCNFVGWLCDTVLRTTVDAVFTSEAYGDGLAAALERRFGTPVRHECVDRERAAVPISGTRIRSDLDRYRSFLDALVYADLVPRIGIVGGESSGKTTLARKLAERLNTVWAQEYGRELWGERHGDLRFDDMLAIGREQIAREQRLAQQARRWLVCDTTPLTTSFYSQEIFGSVDLRLERLALRRYDLLILCSPDFPFVQDGTRRDEAFRGVQHRWYVEQLHRRQFHFTVASGSVAERLSTVLSNMPTV